MGAKLSLLAPSAQTVAISSYVDVLDKFRFVELLSNSRFLKTIKAIDTSTGNYVIIKLLIKPTDGYNLKLDDIIGLEAKQSSLLSQFNNVLPWHKIIETDRAGYLIRQHLKTNLYDRLSLRPFLLPIEKSFLIFQMLKIVAEIHSLNIYHGDIKLENFLVTSWNWLMLVDFANYIKPTYIQEDNPNQFSFYYDTSGRRVCYIAPERFYLSQDSNKIIQNVDDDGQYNGEKLTPEMDLFSLGCVIAEVYSDGEPTFTLSQLYKFMKNEFTPDLSSIQDENIKQLVQQLIQIDPNKRPSAKEILISYKDKCFPSYFYDFLYDFLGELNNNDPTLNTHNFSASDFKIDHIYNSYAKLSDAFGFYYINNSTGTINSDSTISLNLNLPGMPLNYNIKPKIGHLTDQAALIMLDIVFSLLRSVKRVSSKLKACELIVALSERINDEEKLDRSLPYLMSLLDVVGERSNWQNNSRYSENIVSGPVINKVLSGITTLLNSCLYITPINVLMFQEYLLPRLTSLYSISLSSTESDLIKISIARNLPYLARISKKFLMMSKTFKSDTFKGISSKLGSISLTSDYNPDLNSFNVPKDELDLRFKDLTLKILIDKNPEVRISLINNILPLCQYFGVDKTNDIILPHLISYLNDSNYRIRLSFLSSVLKIAPFVGVLSFEQYILPLLIQTLGDPEPFVVMKVLEIFNEFVKNKLINPNKEFNVSAIYKELLTNCTNLLLLPNEWIRQGVLTLIVSIGENLTDADRYCFLYPVIKEFLSYDPPDVSWETLYVCLTKPLSRQIYELAIKWSLNQSKMSLFWKSKNFSAINVGINSPKKKLISFSKNMGKSVYLPKLNNGFNTTLTNGEKPSLPLSADDKQWVIKLKSIGLDDKDLLKLFILRDYISHISRTPKLLIDEPSKNNDQLFYQLQDEVSLKPRNIFFQISYESEPLISGSKIIQSNVDASSLPGDSVSLKDFESRRGSNSLILPNLNKVKASVQTIEANVLGELEFSYDGVNHDSFRTIPKRQSSNHLSTHKVFASNNSKIVTANFSHDYRGDNPFILSYLSDVDLDPALNDFPEFGSFVKSSKSTMTTIKEKESYFKPTGVLLSHITQEEDDGITCVISSPTGEFIITGSEKGNLRVWDSSKLKDMMSLKKSPSLNLNLNSSITSIDFIPDRFVFAASTIDGLIRIFRINVLRNNKKITRYLDIVVIRKYELEHLVFATSLQFYISDKQNTLFITTSNSKIIAMDIIKMSVLFELQNPQIHGGINTFIIGDKMSWALLGTNTGILCLWDLRFRLLIKSWKVLLDNSPTAAIKKLMIFPGDYKLPTGNIIKDAVIMIGGSESPDISIWSIPEFECKQILRTSYPENRAFGQKYSLKEVSNSLKDYNIDYILKDVSLNLDDVYIDDKSYIGDLSTTSLKYYPSENCFLSTTWDKRIIIWNLNNIIESQAIGKNTETLFVLNSSMVSEVYRGKTSIKNLTDKSHGYNLKSITSLQLDSISNHQDMITGAEIVSIPFEMIISVDRIGTINVYK
ncbi:uncharacterized protein RJT21DRAFT_119569 [Scheffersomyces amazonensis]|uniref:uncharacterized protein n=1 Tax=Scheffersomyces amazonensis TaxID=1078765 RepID=UPI00315CA66C